MNLVNCMNYEEMSQKGAAMLIETIKKNPKAVITFATGSSPKRMYEVFVECVNRERIDLSEVTFLKLDEWLGVPPEAGCTCTTFIQKNLLEKLYMPPKQFVEFVSDAADVEQELKKVNDFIAHHDLDLMILGLGMNGHLGLNEPSDFLHYECHCTDLSAKTKTHDMTKGYSLEKGISIGMEEFSNLKRC